MEALSVKTLHNKRGLASFILLTNLPLDLFQ